MPKYKCLNCGLVFNATTMSDVICKNPNCYRKLATKLPEKKTIHTFMAI